MSSRALLRFSVLLIAFASLGVSQSLQLQLKGVSLTVGKGDCQGGSSIFTREGPVQPPNPPPNATFSAPDPITLSCYGQGTLQVGIDGIALEDAPAVVSGTLDTRRTGLGLPVALALGTPLNLRFRFRVNINLGAPATRLNNARVDIDGCNSAYRVWTLDRPVHDSIVVQCPVTELQRASDDSFIHQIRPKLFVTAAGQRVRIDPIVRAYYVDPRTSTVNRPAPPRPGEMAVPDFERAAGPATAAPFNIAGIGVSTDPVETGGPGIIRATADVNRWPMPNAPQSFDWTIDGRDPGGHERAIGISAVPTGPHRLCARAHNGQAVTPWLCTDANVPASGGAPVRPPAPPPVRGGGQTLAPGAAARVQLAAGQPRALYAACEGFRDSMAFIELAYPGNIRQFLQDAEAAGRRPEAEVLGGRPALGVLIRAIATCGKVLSAPRGKVYERAQEMAGGAPGASGPAFDIEATDGVIDVRVPQGSSCQINTPAAIVSAPAQAEFSVMHDPRTKETRLMTKSGVVAIASIELLELGVPAANATYRIAAGQSIRIGPTEK